MNLFTVCGSTNEEQKMAFMCDTLLLGKKDAYFRAVDAPAYLFYRWIYQMKVAPYSYDRLDNGGQQSPQYLKNDEY